MNKVEIFRKLIEDLFVEIYLGKNELNSKENFQLEYGKRLNAEFEKEELIEIVQLQRKEQELKWDEPYSKKRKMEFYQLIYIPFLKSIQNEIKKSRLEKFKIEIQNAKDFHLNNLNEYHKRQLQKVHKELDGLEIEEKKKNEYLRRSIKDLENTIEFLRLVPNNNFFSEKDKFKQLVANFEDIYESNKEKLLEYELEILRIHLEKASSMLAFDIVIEARKSEVMKFNDTIAILLIE